MKRYKIIASLLLCLILCTGLMVGCLNSHVSKIGNLEVQLNDSSGNPLAGGKVISNTQPEGQLKITGSTDSDGKVVYNDIIAGKYEFYISRFDYQQKNFSVNVVQGKTTTLTFILDHD